MSVKRKNRLDLIVFAAFAVAGLLFSVGLYLVSPPRGEGLIATAIHLLTPMALMGLIGILLARPIISKVRSSAFGYSLFTLLGGVAGFFIISILDYGELSAEAYYLAIWVGFTLGVTIRFSIDGGK